MVPYARRAWRMDRTAEGERAEEWLGALRAFDEGRAEVLKEGEGVSVLRAEMRGRAVVVKRWDLAAGPSRVRSLLRVAPADRHWRGAAWLAKHGFPTARCLALATEGDRSVPRRWLVMEEVEGESLLEVMAGGAGRAGGAGGGGEGGAGGALNVRRQHSLAREVGRQVARFDSLARHNRDHKPSNLIVSWGTGEARPRVSIIDCVGLRAGGDVARMLASLLIEPAGCGVRVRRALAARVLRACCEGLVKRDGSREERRSLERRLAGEVMDRIRRHGDPRPRVDPLARGRAQP